MLGIIDPNHRERRGCHGIHKEKITATALALFAQRGYDGVSVRDICKQVGIKESSLYYHFPSKQAILTTLLSHFENRAAEGMAQLEQALGDQQGPWGQVSYRMVCQAFFEGYLMDPFCNQVLRLLQMEQFHNPDLGEIYERWMFRVPLTFQGRMFTALVDLGLLHPATGEDLAVAFYGPIHLFAQRWLFRGPLSEAGKAAFRQAAYRHVQRFFQERGTDAWQPS